MRRFSLLFLCFFSLFFTSSLFAQKLSDNERKLAISEINEQIRIVSRFSYGNPEVLPVYSLQLYTADDVIKKYNPITNDAFVFEKWYELKLLVTQNKEIIDFLLPRTVEWFYRNGIEALSVSPKNITKASASFKKAIEMNPKHIMSQYQLAKLSLDSGNFAAAGQRLTVVLKDMKPSEDERKLIINLLDYHYNKDLLKALALTGAGKYAYALDILIPLESFCTIDPTAVCDKKRIEQTINICRSGVFNDHLVIADKALKLDKNAAAETFAVSAYEYFSENKESISDTMGLVTIAKKIATNYLEEAKSAQGDRKIALQKELLEKARFLSSFTDEKFQQNIAQEITRIEPPKSKFEKELDSLSNAIPPKGYRELYKFGKNDDTNLIVNTDVLAKTDGNTLKPHLSRSVSKELDDKFYETRSFLSVNSYEQALEVLSSANRLAKIKSEKAEVEEMYRMAIREITTKRMANAEYFIWQGRQNEADSLINLTNELISTYKMQDDPNIIQIMQSYLKTLDAKVCVKKQDEINGYVYSIMDCMKRFDYYKADVEIRKALAIHGSEGCKLDNSKIQSLRIQIEKPLEYISLLDIAYRSLERTDTTAYIKEYGDAETFYNTYDLGTMSVSHTPLREILNKLNNESFILNAIEILVRYKEYPVALEALGALKDLEYKAGSTKSIQKRIGKLMSLDMYNRAIPQQDASKAIDKYRADKWYKAFVSDYDKYVKDWYGKGKFK